MNKIIGNNVVSLEEFKVQKKLLQLLLLKLDQIDLGDDEYDNTVKLRNIIVILSNYINEYNPEFITEKNLDKVINILYSEIENNSCETYEINSMLKGLENEGKNKNDVLVFIKKIRKDYQLHIERIIKI